MKLWIDDVRMPDPKEYEWYKSVNTAKERIVFCEEQIDLFSYKIQRNILRNHLIPFGKQRRLSDNKLYQHIIDEFTITLIDIDHDAGDYANDGGDYIKLLDWLEATDRNYPIHIHSMNVVGRMNMEAICRRNGWKIVE